MSKKVIVIGAGPSWYKKLDLVRKFKGDIIAVDILLPMLTEEGIKPNYVVTFEKKEGIELVNFTKKQKEIGFKLIINPHSDKKLIKHLNDLGYNWEGFTSYRHERINNVGLFGVRYAREVLGADEIYLIGFDHTGANVRTEIDYTAYHVKGWIECFRIFLDDEAHKCKVINCTGAGDLYLDRIIDGRNINEITV